MRKAMAASLLLHGAMASAWALWPTNEPILEEPLLVELVLAAPPPAPEPIAAAPLPEAKPLAPPRPRSAPSPTVVKKRSEPAPVPATAEASPLSSPSMASDAARPTPAPGTESPSTASATAWPASPGSTRDAVYHLGSANTPLPEYPWSARRRGREGRVVIEMDVDPEGRPVGVTVIESSGDDALDRAALDTLARWHLLPAMKKGIFVASRLRVPIRFELQESAEIAVR